MSIELCYINRLICAYSLGAKASCIHCSNSSLCELLGENSEEGGDVSVMKSSSSSFPKLNISSKTKTSQTKTLGNGTLPMLTLRASICSLASRPSMLHVQS